VERYPWVIPYAVTPVVTTLALVVLAVVLVLLYGLYDARVDNDKIFAAIAPAFSSITGGFTGILGVLGGYIAGKRDPEAQHLRRVPHDRSDHAAGPGGWRLSGASRYLR
jgi:hypothetical protein